MNQRKHASERSFADQPNDPTAQCSARDKKMNAEEKYRRRKK
jgi:hypothetical protein